MIGSQQTPLLGKVTLSSTLEIKTGIHVGGGNEKLEIGGLNKPVVRDPITRQPYLPGSSVKGKLRSILERIYNKPINRDGGSSTYRYESDDWIDGSTEIKSEQGKQGAIPVYKKGNSNTQPAKWIALVDFQGAKSCPVSRIFGSTGKDCWIPTNAANAPDTINDEWQSINHNGQSYTPIRGRNCPARLIVRDCHLQEESATRLEQVDTGLYMTEWKFENGIDRITAAANPRQVERVPAGSKFNFELVYTVEDIEQAKEDLLSLAIALHILEQDALGGHGSRGYGKVVFHGLKLSYQEYSKYLPKPDPKIQQFSQFVDSLSIEEDGLSSPMAMMECLEQKQLPEAEASTTKVLNKADESGDA